MFLLIVEQALGKVVGSGRAATVFKAQMPNIVQINAVVDTIVESVLCNTGFILLIAKTVGKVVRRAADEPCLSDMEELCMTVADA